MLLFAAFRHAAFLLVVLMRYDASLLLFSAISYADFAALRYDATLRHAAPHGDTLPCAPDTLFTLIAISRYCYHRIEVRFTMTSQHEPCTCHIP